MYQRIMIDFGFGSSARMSLDGLNNVHCRGVRMGVDLVIKVSILFSWTLLSPLRYCFTPFQHLINASCELLG